MFEKLFQALFSYRPVVFQQGDFRFDITTASFVAAGIAAIIMVGAVITYRSVGVNGRTRDRVVLTALRMAALALVVFCLFRPTLVVKAAIPQQNVVAVLLWTTRAACRSPTGPTTSRARSSCGSSSPPTRVRC